MKNDIDNRVELLRFLKEFYNKAQNDPLIGGKFKGLDMDAHIDTIADFWESMIFGTTRYEGDPFGKHVNLKLTNADFDQWLLLFESTIDEMFNGSNVEEMKNRARTIATVFRHKLVD